MDENKHDQGLFDGIIGHEAVVKFLAASLDYQTTAHAYLFVGPRSVGKTTVLVRLLRALIGGGREAAGGNRTGDPFAAFVTYPDLTLVRRGTDEKTGKLKKNITVEQIREMRSRLSMGSFLNSWKIAVVDDAENLSEEAANALLKTLEEPTRKTVIFLLAPALAGVPETVASRCQVVRFRPVAKADISRGLETLGVGRAEAERAAASSGGRPGLAIRLATDAGERAAYELTLSEGLMLMTAPLHERLAAVAGMIPEKSGSLETAGLLAEKMSVWETLIRDGLTRSLGLPGYPMSGRAEVEAWRRGRRPAEVAAILRIFGDVRRALQENVNPRLAVERLAIAL